MAGECKGLQRGACLNDLGFLFQTGLSTRALLGLFGTDAFRLAVSPDGSTFLDALRADPATGIVDQLRGMQRVGATDGTGIERHDPSVPDCAAARDLGTGQPVSHRKG